MPSGSTLTRFAFETETDLRDAAHEAAIANGLSSTTEFLRLVLMEFVETKQLPESLRGKRSVIRRGRPRTINAEVAATAQ
jgi:hypothetical protein